MKKILLTSGGFDNKNVANKFLELVNKPANEIKVLFITTAAVEPDAVMILPACIEDLTKVLQDLCDNKAKVARYKKESQKYILDKLVKKPNKCVLCNYTSISIVENDTINPM